MRQWKKSGSERYANGDKTIYYQSGDRIIEVVYDAQGERISYFLHRPGRSRVQYGSLEEAKKGADENDGD